MGHRLKKLEQNRQLILDTLEHIKNVTNLGIRMIESPRSIAISLPNEIIPVADSEFNRSFIRTGAQLVFTQDPDDGIKVRHKLPQLKQTGELSTGEIITVIPTPKLSREVILEKVIDFLERVKEVK